MVYLVRSKKLAIILVLTCKKAHSIPTKGILCVMPTVFDISLVVTLYVLVNIYFSSVLEQIIVSTQLVMNLVDFFTFSNIQHLTKIPAYYYQTDITKKQYIFINKTVIKEMIFK